jgi:hypothetical protein
LKELAVAVVLLEAKQVVEVSMLAEAEVGLLVRVALDYLQQVSIVVAVALEAEELLP